jgi:dTDP-4-dehydrorhamnose 3,5-epimerase
VTYEVSAPYSPEHDCATGFDGPAIGVAWPEGSTPLLSAKDAVVPMLAD